MENKDFVQSSAFLGADCLFEGHENLSFFINMDCTGFYVFSMAEGMHPIAKWVRRDRNSEGSTFEPSYTAEIHYAGDRVNGYKIGLGLYVDMGTGTNQAGAARAAAIAILLAPVAVR